jgi:hypothetical protein
MPLDISAATSILKNLYEAPIREWLDQSTMFLSKVKKNTKNFEGLKAIIPVHRGRNVGTGSRAEWAALPIPGAQSHSALEYAVKYLYGTIRLSGPVMEASKSNTGSFARALQNEMTGLMKDCQKDMNRQLWADGSSILTLCGTTSNSTTVVVQSTKFLQVGMVIDVVVKADGTTSTGAIGRTVDAINSSTTFTISGNAITTDNTFAILKSGGRNDSPGTWGNAWEMWGLEALVSNANPGNGLTDTIGGLTRVANVDWQANLLGNSATLRPLTTDLMQQAWDAINVASGEEPDMIVTNHAILRRYGALLTPDRRYTGGGLQTFDGGWKGLCFNAVPVVADPDAHATLYPQKLEALYFLYTPSFELHQMSPWGWMDKDGAILSRCQGTLTSGSYTYVAQADAYEAALRCYQQLGIDRANTQAKLYDISESA